MDAYYVEAKRRLDEGEEYQKVVDDFIRRLEVAQAASNDASNDIEEENVLDALHGWCSPSYDLRTWRR